MNTSGFGSTVLVYVAGSLITLAGSNLRIWASEPYPTAAEAMAPAQQIAQATETGCRQTNSTTGVYTQPNLDSPAQGVLNPGQTVRLELVGTGTGWTRITQPLIGWVEAKYLTPAAACASLGQAINPAATPAATPASGVSPTALPPAQSLTQTVTVVCEVLPTEGLVVRSEPDIRSNTVLYTIPKGTHQFQFTSNHLTSQAGNQQRYWSYIMAPYQGWISLGIVGGNFNLGGRECG